MYLCHLLLISWSSQSKFFPFASGLAGLIIRILITFKQAMSRYNPLSDIHMTYSSGCALMQYPRKLMHSQNHDNSRLRKHASSIMHHEHCLDILHISHIVHMHTSASHMFSPRM
eukprot:c27068_g3_i1 orf=88-429(-)